MYIAGNPVGTPTLGIARSGVAAAYRAAYLDCGANINLQIAPGVQGDHREGMEAYFNWMESRRSPRGRIPSHRCRWRNG